MSRSNPGNQQHGRMSRIAWLVASLFIAQILSGCDGGLFGTGTGDNSELVDPVANSEGDVTPGITDPGTGTNTPDAAPENPIDTTAESDSQPISINFSNTTPSGIDSSSNNVPSIKLVNLTDVEFTLATIEDQTIDNTISVSAQSTSALLSVNTGETTVSLSREDNDVVVAGLYPLNAAADSLTTLVIEMKEVANTATSQDDIVRFSLLALDTRAVVSANSMAEVRIVATAAAGPDTLPTTYTLTPSGDDTSGAEVVLLLSNRDNPAVGVYSLANAGSYVLSSSDESFSPQPVTLSADEIYTIIITTNPQNPVYVEIDSLTIGE